MKKTTINLFIIVLVSVSILFFFTQNSNPLNIRSFVVLSGSMEPDIQTGSIVVTKPEFTYKIGDIVSYHLGNQIVTHRIANFEYKNDRALFVTKGDANQTKDQSYPTETDVIGKVVFSIPYAGYLLSSSRSLPGFILFVMIPGIAIVIIEIVNIVKKFKLLRGKENTHDSTFAQSSTLLALLVITGVIANTILQTSAFFTSLSLYPSNTISATLSVTPQVIINEINWSSAVDEWVELLNTTDSDIDISNWVVERLGTGSGLGANLIIPSDSIIPANDFFLISNRDKDGSAINVDPDWVNNSVSLVDSGEQLVLKDNFGIVIDTADNDGSGWFSGSNSAPKKSMERKTPPGDGTNPANWQDATTHINMDGSGPNDEFGTPKAENGI